MTSRLAEIIKERDAASSTCMELVKMVDKLIDKLLDTRMVMAEQEIESARRLLAKVRKGGRIEN
jgi:hypothetical protein